MNSTGLWAPLRRSVLAAAGGFGLLSSVLWAAMLLPALPTPALAAEDTSIRPFRIKVPEAALVDLRRRLAETRWPERELVADQSQGVQLATMQALVRYWQQEYNWRKVEARLNALPQFVTTIDGVDISHGIWRARGGCLRCRHPLVARLWVLGQAKGDGLGPGAHRARLG